VTNHLSTLQVKQLCVSALPEDEVVAAGIHCAECQSCHRRFVEELKRLRGSAPFTFTLNPEFWFRDDHVDFDLLVALADKSLDQETEEVINIHLQTCETCREDLRSFLVSRAATDREMNISYGRPEHQPVHQAGSAAWWQRLQAHPIYAMAAIVLLSVALLIGVIALNRNGGPLEAKNQTNLGIEPSPDSSGSPTPGVIASPSSVDAMKVATLKDASGQVTVDQNGRVTGLDELSENSRRDTAQAVLSEQLAPAEVLRRLSGEQSGLRGSDNGPQGFRLLYPVRRVITEDRPTFRWESLPGVSNYQVHVLDTDGKQVGQSVELPPSQTQWRAPAPFGRGQVFSWVVTALVDGKKVVSPAASEPEMKFAVLTTAQAQELSRLRKSNSHLALGVFYARAGLMDEAEREFQSLVKLNPLSELPRKLLQSVRSIRKAD
jgi:hypothetical protein